MNIIERNNIKIQGRGEKALIFTHGYGCNQNIWRRLVPYFERDYQIILFDHVGAGSSDISQYDRQKYRSLQGYADDIIEICQTLEIEQLIYVGHSVSTMIGVLCANKEPKLFERLILINASPCYLNEEDYAGGLSGEAANDMIRLLESNYESWVKAMAPVIMGNHDRPELTEELMEMFCQARPYIASHFGHVAFLSDHRQDISLLKRPTLLIQCLADQVVPLSVSEFLHKTLERSELVIIEAEGHCPHVSDPEKTAAVMKQYLAHN